MAAGWEDGFDPETWSVEARKGEHDHRPRCLDRDRSPADARRDNRRRRDHCRWKSVVSGDVCDPSPLSPAIPSREIRRRFDDATIERLLEHRLVGLARPRRIDRNLNAIRGNDLAALEAATLNTPSLSDRRTTGSRHLLERGRKLFAGQAQFLKGVVAMSGLPPADRVEVCFRRAFQCRQVDPDQCAHRAQGPRARVEHAGPDPGNQLFHAGPDSHYLVDLPGYGFAKAPLAVVEKWQKLLKAYLVGAARPCAAPFVLIDARHGIKEVDDRDPDAARQGSAVPFQVVLTKADKVKAAERGARSLTRCARQAPAHIPAAYPELVVTSSEKGDGIATLRSIVSGLA